jgi:hypothetical protein
MSYLEDRSNLLIYNGELPEKFLIFVIIYNGTYMGNYIYIYN